MFKRIFILSAITLPLLAVASPAQQLPFLPPSTGGPNSANDIVTSPQPNLNDALTINRQASIFFDYIRDSSSSIATLLIAPSPSYTTILVPANSAIIALSRKPHQGPPVVDGGKIAIKGSREEEEEMAKYLERWVSAHVIRANLEDEDKETYETMEGRNVTFSLAEDGQVFIDPGKVTIVDEINASNGKFFILSGVIPLDD